MAAAPQTGIKNADDLINLAHAFGLTVTVEPTDRETLTSYVVCISIPVPPAYAGTELGRAIAGDTLTLLWTKAHRPGARGRLEDATAWTVDSHRKLRTQQLVTNHIHSLGHQSARYVRETAPKVDDVVDAPHHLFIDGEQRTTEGVSADFVRKIVRNRSHHGRPIHQDADGAIVIENRRYVPQPAPAEDTAPAAEERQHVRTVNGGTPQLIPTPQALAALNHPMMGGKREVRRMSAARSTARIVYRDGRTVDLRPATDGTTPPVLEQRPTVAELTGDIPESVLAFLAETYTAVADGTAIPVSADMIRPGMDVIAAVRLEDRTVDTVTHHNGPGPQWVRITWTTRSHADSVHGDACVFEPGHALVVTVDSLERLYGAETAPAAEAEQENNAPRQTYRGRKIRITKGTEYGKVRVKVNGTDLGHHSGGIEDALRWVKGTIRHADEVGVGSGRYAPEWYAPGTFELCPEGHAQPISGECGHHWCAEQRTKALEPAGR